MSVHIVLAAVHGWLAGGAPSPTSGVSIPDPAPQAPPGELATATNLILGWMKWGGLVGAVGAIVAAGIMMAIGRRNRNNMAIEAAISVPWVVGGLALILGASSIVGFVVG